MPSQTWILPYAPSSPIFSTPYDMSTILDINVYVGATEFVGVSGSKFTVDCVGLANLPSPYLNYYPIVKQGKNIFWGSNTAASQLTLEGQHLFVNTVWYATGL